jgi:hypothetical protein
LSVTIRLADHTGRAEDSDGLVDARRVINNGFITANFVVCAVRDPYGTEKNRHHAVVAGHRTAGAGGAVYEHCDLRLIPFKGPFSGFSGFSRMLFHPLSDPDNRTLAPRSDKPSPTTDTQTCRSIELVFAV